MGRKWEREEEREKHLRFKANLSSVQQNAGTILHHKLINKWLDYIDRSRNGRYESDFLVENDTGDEAKNGMSENERVNGAHGHEDKGVE